MTFLVILSALVCVSVIISSIYLAAGLRKLGKLDECSSIIQGYRPLVSIIIPVCNEEENIENTLLSLSSQDYEELEIIVVNDRSSDGTASVLSKMQKRLSGLKVITISTLPDGWMGKANALKTGAERAVGKYLVFTDGDVRMEKSVISRAVNFLVQTNLDHLSLIFKNISPGFLLNSLIVDSGIGMFLLFRPWSVKKAGSRSFIGVGAFNMVKASTYHAIGGHEGIKMHPIDDVMLGKIIKEHGYKQDCLFGGDLLVVPWYNSVAAMVDGLMKNIFAVIHYRLTLVPVVVSVVSVVSIYPFWALLFGPGIVKILSVVTLGIRTVQFYKALAIHNHPKYYAPGHLLTPYISCFLMIRAACLTLSQNGIIWRGQHYPLSELKASRPLLF